MSVATEGEGLFAVRNDRVEGGAVQASNHASPASQVVTDQVRGGEVRGTGALQALASAWMAALTSVKRVEGDKQVGAAGRFEVDGRVSPVIESLAIDANLNETSSRFLGVIDLLMSTCRDDSPLPARMLKNMVVIDAVASLVGCPDRIKPLDDHILLAHPPQSLTEAPLIGRARTSNNIQQQRPSRLATFQQRCLRGLPIYTSPDPHREAPVGQGGQATSCFNRVGCAGTTAVKPIHTGIQCSKPSWLTSLLILLGRRPERSVGCAYIEVELRTDDIGIDTRWYRSRGRIDHLPPAEYHGANAGPVAPTHLESDAAAAAQIACPVASRSSLMFDLAAVCVQPATVRPIVGASGAGCSRGLLDAGKC
ncbi:hypothetical protein ON010_g17995 [Phytophthora cinnamomi]|nr:hypothetical protein ON010_g17995 [Phytophthora cinnamomi]